MDESFDALNREQACAHACSRPSRATLAQHGRRTRNRMHNNNT